jgi:5-methylcytosine-specific restriction protein A
MPNAPKPFRSHHQPQRKPWQQTRGTNKQRGYSTDWNKLRNAYIQEHPICERCEAKGHITEAKEVHHIEPFQGIDDPLRMDPNNLFSVCPSCHRKLEHERRRNNTHGQKPTNKNA